VSEEVWFTRAKLAVCEERSIINGRCRSRIVVEGADNFPYLADRIRLRRREKHKDPHSGLSASEIRHALCDDAPH
jgi:hypothetical protein